MEDEERNEIKEALINLFKDHGITTMEEFESVDEEEGAVMYEDLKAGILEVFDLPDLELIDELTEEILK